MKRFPWIRCAVLAAAGVVLLAGCAILPGMGQGEDMTLRVSMYNDIAYSGWRTYVEGQCPDVTFVRENNRNSIRNLLYQAGHSDLADIVMIRRFENDSAAELAPYLMNLQGEELTDTFDADALAPFTFDGKICWYPAPGMIECLMANASLFEQYGIALPQTLNDLEAACLKFQEHGLDGLSIDASAGFRSTFILEGLGYNRLYAQGGGKQWKEQLLLGAAPTLSESDGAQMAGFLRELTKNNVLEPQDLTVDTADTRSKFDAENAAMFTFGSDYTYEGKTSGTYCAIPCLGADKEDRILYTYPVFSTAVSKGVEKNAARKAAVERVLKVMYSSDAQKILADRTGALMSYNTDVELPVSDTFKSVADLIREKKCFIRFLNRNTFSAFSAAVQSVVGGDVSDADFTKAFNTAIQASPNMTVIGTSKVEAGNQFGEQYPLERAAASVLAQTVQAQTGADVVLIESKAAAAPLYKGNYTESDLNAVIAEEKLYGADLTGEQLQNIFDDAIRATTTYRYHSVEPLVDYPALSGMTARLLADGTKNTLLAGGAALDPAGVYHAVISDTILTALQELQNQNAAAFVPLNDTLQSCFRVHLAAGNLPQAVQYYEVEAAQ